MLLNKGADANIDYKGKTPLRFRKYDIVKLLLNYSNVSIQDEFGECEK